MPNQLHKNLTGADAVHPAAFVQSSDPGAVGPNLQWIDTSSGPPYTLKLRNAANTAWLVFAAGTTGTTGPAGSTGPAGITTVVTSGAAPYVCVQDRKTAGTDGGTFTTGADRQRNLNTFVANDQNLAVLVNNQITLPAGLWRTHIVCPARFVDQHVAWLYNVTDGGELLPGQNALSGSTTNNDQTVSIISGRFSLSTPKLLEVRHRCGTTRATDGFGLHMTFTRPYEVYTVVEFWLEGGPPPFFGSTGLMENPSLDKLAARRQVASSTSMHHAPLTAPA